MDRPSFKKNKIQEYIPTPSPEDLVDFTLGKDKILDVLEPFAPKIAHIDDSSVDDEISAYNSYFNSFPKPKNNIGFIQEQIQYNISDGIKIYVDKDLGITNSELLKIISNALI